MKQTNALDVDKHMMKYIEEEMKKRRGGEADAEDTNEQSGNYNGDTDILDELGIRVCLFANRCFFEASFCQWEVFRFEFD